LSGRDSTGLIREDQRAYTLLPDASSHMRRVDG
jgi:hypothetical protein